MNDYEGEDICRGGHRYRLITHRALVRKRAVDERRGGWPSERRRVDSKRKGRGMGGAERGNSRDGRAGKQKTG